VPGSSMTNEPRHNGQDDPDFREAVRGLLRGDFSRLKPLFDDQHGGGQCSILAWYQQGLFDQEPEALNEALSCACFNGKTQVADFLLNHGVDPAAGDKTGSNAFHWAADRGQLDTVRLLIEHKAPLEVKNMYGGTVLGATVWSAIHETRPHHVAIIEALIEAGARIEGAGYPTGNEAVDAVLSRHGAKP
jgi:hypothetical protein